MSTQPTHPEALRLADELDSEFAQGRISNHTGRKAATELRRLHGLTQGTQPTDDEIAAILPEETSWEFDIGPEEAIRFARAVLAKWGTPATGGGPVAWLDPWTGTKVTTDYDAYGKHGIPLYTSPQPVREPLSLDEFRKAFHEYTGCTVGTNQGLLMAAKTATERAHGIGITGGQHGTDT